MSGGPAGFGATKRVLVTAGFGNQARVVIPLLVQAGFWVRALRASAGSGPGPCDFGAAEVMAGDASDVDVLGRAMHDIDVVYHIGPTFHPREREMGFAVVEVARRVGVTHLIFSSVLHPIASGLIQHAIKRDIEERIIESGLNFTILQPSDYMQVSTTEQAMAQGVFILPFSLERRQALVDLNDVAEVVVKVTTEGAAHYGATYELSGEDNLTGYEIAAALSRAVGREYRPEQISIETLQDQYFAGIDKSEVTYQRKVLAALVAWYDKHDFVGNGNVLAMLLGRRPTRYEAFAAAAFAHHRKARRA